MINVIEAAALAAVEPLLPAGNRSLGIDLDVHHFAATPIGMRGYATAELVRVDGRTPAFRVEACNGKEPIGGGSHQRVVVNVARLRRTGEEEARSVARSIRATSLILTVVSGCQLN